MAEEIDWDAVQREIDTVLTQRWAEERSEKEGQIQETLAHNRAVREFLLRFGPESTEKSLAVEASWTVERRLNWLLYACSRGR